MTFMLHLAEFLCRLKDVWFSGGYDAVFLQKGIAPIAYRFLDRLLFFCNKKVIFDFDDGITVRQISCFRRFPLTLLEDRRQFSRIVKAAKMVVVGNQTLRKDIEGMNENVLVIPTPVDTACYVPRPERYRQKERLTILWSGNCSGYFDLKIAAPALRELCRSGRCTCTILGDVYDKSLEEALAGIEINFVPWSVENEQKAFSEADIGIMPQHDILWNRRKCAYKALLYMACGIPVVTSAVGMTTEFLIDGENGYLAGNDGEWQEKLALLVHDVGLREKIGMAGRKTVEEKFSLAVWGPRWAQAVQGVLKAI